MKKYCDICGYEHKERPESFCLALKNGTLSNHKVKTNVVKDILGDDLVAKSAARGIGI